MTDDTQPEAMDLADWLEAVGGGPSAKRCAALLREQHTRIAELESELEAVGAGGVSGPLVGRAAPPTAQAEGWTAEQALRNVLAAVQRHMPPDGPDAKDTLSEIIAIVDPWPLGPLEKS